MVFNIAKKDLENDALYDTLQALYGVFNKLNIDIIAIGAVARDVYLKILNVNRSDRVTTDLDIAIALKDWHQFDVVKEELIKNYFHKDPAKQRFWYKGPNGDNDYEVDVVPFGNIAVKEMIAWPPEGNPEMSVRCFEDVFAVADNIVVDNKFSMKMAPIAGQFLIKLDAWIDRHGRTDKDALDMYYIMDNYYIAHITHKVPAPKEVEITGEDFDPLIWGAKWIACEVKTFLSKEHLDYYKAIINEELAKEESSALVSDLMKGQKGKEYREDSNLYIRIRESLKSILEILAK